MLQRLDPRQLLLTGVRGSGCFFRGGHRFLGDNLGHRPVVPEDPGLIRSYVARGGGLLDDTPCTMRRKPMMAFRALAQAPHD